MGKVDLLRKLLRPRGYDVVEYDPLSHPALRRAELLRGQDIGVTLDVGANCGQFGSKIRKFGYAGRLISFEPLSQAFAQLQACAKGDTLWQTEQLAIGDTDGEIELNVAGNSGSSSILPMDDAHLAAAPESRYIGKEKAPIAKLSTVFDRYCRPSDRVFLKVDTQGYEMHVLRGAEQVLPRIAMIQLEISLQVMYAGEQLLPDMCAALYRWGYVMVSVEPTFCHPTTKEMLQVDAIFRRATPSA